jgi:2-C-methyl-D-erythritol 4-phosphate cytidylyltransferase
MHVSHSVTLSAQPLVLHIVEPMPFSSRRDAGVVLPCAGSGTRVGSDRPKQFLDLGTKPVFHWALSAFLEHERVAAVVLVVSPGEIEPQERALAQSGFAFHLASGHLRLAVGGAERWESVRNGVVALPAHCRLVAIHDVARPFVTSSDIDQVLAAAEFDGAATLALPCPDTVKWAATLPDTGSASAPLVETTLDRRRVWLTQTPQAFRREVLVGCYEQLPVRQDLSPTDEASLAEAFGHKVRLVKGAQRLHKITTADDLDWARWTAEKISA